MYTRALVKKLILPSISIGVVRAEGKEDDCDSKKKLIRPRDLPLYVETPKCLNCSNTVESEDGFLLTTVRCVRQELQTVLEQAKVIQAEANSMVDNIKKETSEAVSYLQQEENLLPRMGAIGFGAFAGYLLAVRKGIIKKMLYSATGAGLIAAIAYPNEAKEYTEEVLCELKKYAVIGYHFVNGADVDWKKLNETTACSKNSGITSGFGPSESDSRGPQGEPVQGTSDPSITETKPGENEEALTPSKSEGMAGASSGDVVGSEESNKMSVRSKSATGSRSVGDDCTDDPVPQDRPKNHVPSREFGSYSKECRAKGPYSHRQNGNRSSPAEPRRGGVTPERHSDTSEPLPETKQHPVTVYVAPEVRSGQGNGYNGQGSGYNGQSSRYNNQGSGYNGQSSGYSGQGGGYNGQGGGYNGQGGGYSGQGGGYNGQGGDYSSQGNSYTSQGNGYNGQGSPNAHRQPRSPEWVEPPPCPVPPSFNDGPIYQDGDALSRSNAEQLRRHRNGNGSSSRYSSPESPRTPQSAYADRDPCLFSPSPGNGSTNAPHPRSKSAYNERQGPENAMPAPPSVPGGSSRIEPCQTGQCLRRSKRSSE